MKSKLRSFARSVTLLHLTFLSGQVSFYCEQECVKMLPTEEDMKDEQASRWARELTSLMDEVDALGVEATSEDSEDEVMARIEYLANYLSWFYPNLLDPRFS